MHIKAWGYALSIMLALSSVASARPKDPLPSFMDARKGDTKAAKIIGLEAENRFDGAISPEMADYRGWERVPGRDPIGEEITIGSTWYDYQHNGSMGKMIAVDVDGGVHFVWMKGYDAQQATRHTVWNFLEDGNLLYDPDDVPVVDNGSRSGYACLALLPADNRTMTFYHVIGPPDHPNDYTGTAQGFDFDRGFGAFNSSYPNPWPNTQLIWPHGTVSRTNITHLLSTENGDFPAGNDQNWQRIAYWKGEPDRGFENWTWNDPPINLDTSGTISAVASASVTSNRVVMATFHNRVGSDLGAWSEAPGWWQKNNDIRYWVSEDGRNFDFQRGMKSLTKIQPPIPELANDLQEAYGDTFRPYCDMDIQFDPWGDDNLYAVFPTAGFFEEPVEDDDPEPADGATAEHCILWFWSEHGGADGADTITMVYDGYYFNRTDNGGSWHSRAGAWRMNADRGSIAFDPDREGTIYLTWVNYPKIQELNPDYNADPENQVPFFYEWPAQDTSQLGYSSAEIMISVSTDYGITWREPVNATETVWEGEAAPEPGEMASEAWQSCAYLADGFLHLAYIRDTEAGGTIQTPSEGPATNSPWIYQKIDLDDIPVNDPVQLPVEGFMFHNYLDFRPVVPEPSVGRNPGAPTPANQVTVTATATGGGDHALDRVELVYRVNGEGEQVVGMATVDGDIWGGAIPAQAEGAVVWYRVRAVNDVGLSAIAPQQNWWWGYVVRNAGEQRIRDIQERPEDWATDYSLYRGYEVTVTGIVTTPSSFNDTYGAYAIQEASTAWSGVMVRGIEQALNVGDRVRVTGTVFERDMNDAKRWEFETYIQARSFEVVAQGQQVPNVMLLENVADMLYSNGVEALEGCLVEVRDLVVDSLNAPYERPENRLYWPITDFEESARSHFTTIGLTNDEIVAMGIRTFKRGTEIATMKGVLCENFGKYALAPRDRRDLGEVGVENDKTPSPYDFALNPAYPNPFNGLTTLSFSLPRSAYAMLAIYDLSGREVSRIAEGRFEAGQHMLTIDASELATGVYLMQLESNGRTASQKIVLVK